MLEGGDVLNPVYIYRFIRSLLVIGGIILGGIALFYLSKYTYPFIIAMIIAFLMNPLVTFLKRKAGYQEDWLCSFPFYSFFFYLQDSLPCWLLKLFQVPITLLVSYLNILKL